MTPGLTIKEAAALLEVSTKSIRRWIDDGRLPAYKLGGTWRIQRDAIEALVPPLGRAIERRTFSDRQSRRIVEWQQAEIRKLSAIIDEVRAICIDECRGGHGQPGDRLLDVYGAVGLFVDGTDKEAVQ